ncbi:MAG: hypothetical protein E7630_03115 [Ruminococcaceae bacterium]|nr:hypothetical protein [Oscillospiraceae bacterium]
MAFRFHGREYTSRFHPLEAKGTRIECACACTGLLFFLPLVSAPDSRFGRYWANQGLIVLLIQILLVVLWLIVGGALWLLSLIPLIGVLFSILRIAVGILLASVALFYVVYAMVFAASGRAKDIPFLGHMRFIK